MERIYGPPLTVIAVVLSLVLSGLTITQAIPIALCYIVVITFAAIQETRTNRILERSNWKLIVQKTQYGVVYPDHLK